MPSLTAIALRRLLTGLLLAVVHIASAQQAASPPPAPPLGLDPMAERYQLGHGLRLGSGFTLGGYGEASYQEFEGHGFEAGISSLSAMLWWDGGQRWRFFSELELEEGLVFGPGNTTTEDGHLVAERLYVDYAHSDALKLRLGKFLTPVGRWNLSHAPPLTWTTSRPLITETTFPTNATGAMIYGSLPYLPEGLDYSLYASPGRELFPERDTDNFSEAFGGRFSTTVWPHLQLGLSAVTFEQERTPDQRKNLLGFDFLWSYRRFELSGEFAYRMVRGDEERRDEQGMYLQFIAPLSQQLYGVTRYEYFYSQAADKDVSRYLLGLTWRPHPALLVKGEVAETSTHDDPDIPDGVFASLAVLF